MSKIDGTQEVIKGLEKRLGVEKVEANMKKACAIVERAAKEKAPKGKTGDLRKFIASAVVVEEGEVIGKVYSPLEYAPYVEYGTGLFAEEGGRKDVPWAYKDEETGELIFTSGQKPMPYMRPALEDNRLKIMETLMGGLLDV